MVIVDRQDYMKKINNTLSDQKKFTTVNLKGDTLLNFSVNEEKHVGKVLKKLVESNSIIGKTRKLLKPVGSRPGVMYDSCTAHEASVANYPSFWPILSALDTPTYNPTKYLVSILKPFTTNEFIVKDSFHFAEEIVDQQLDFFMGNLDVDSLFTNTPLEETIGVCKNKLFKESETVEGLS